MEDRYYRYNLEEKMKALFQKKRRTFLEDIPTIEFVNSFPGISQSKRQQIRAREHDRGEIYANNDLLDCIIQHEEFWLKYLETAKTIKACSKTATWIRDVLKANPPRCKISREYTEESENAKAKDRAKTTHPLDTAIIEKQRNKERRFTFEEGNYLFLSNVVTQPDKEKNEDILPDQEKNDASDCQFSSKSVLANLGKNDNEVFEVTKKQEVENDDLADDCCEHGENEETFSNPVVKERQVESSRFIEPSDIASSQVSFPSKSFPVNPGEPRNENQSSMTVKLQTKYTDVKTDSENFDKDRSELDVLKPTGQKDLQLSDLNDNMMESSGENEDEKSFFISNTDIKAARPLSSDDSIIATEIDSLKPARPHNQNNCLLAGNVTNQTQKNGNVLQTNKKSHEDYSSDNGFNQPPACISPHGIDQQPTAAVGGNNGNQESVAIAPKSEYNNCTFINCRQCQIDSKGCTIKENGNKKKKLKRIQGNEQISLTHATIQGPVIENVNIGYSDNPPYRLLENSESMQSTAEDNLELGREDFMHNTATPMDQVESLPEENAESLSRSTNDKSSCNEDETTFSEITESLSLQTTGDRNGTDLEINRVDGDNEDGNLQSEKIDQGSKWINTFTRWIFSEVNWFISGGR